MSSNTGKYNLRNKPKPSQNKKKENISTVNGNEEPLNEEMELGHIFENGNDNYEVDNEVEINMREDISNVEPNIDGNSEEDDIAYSNPEDNSNDIGLEESSNRTSLSPTTSQDLDPFTRLYQMLSTDINNIKTDINNTKSELKAEITNQYKELGLKIDSLNTEQNIIKNNIDSLRQAQSENTSKIEQLKEEFTKKLENHEHSLREDFTEQLVQQYNNVTLTINESCEHTKGYVDEKFSKHIKDTNRQIEKIKNTYIEQTTQLVNEGINKTKDELIPIIQENRSELNNHNDILNHLESTIEELKTKQNNEQDTNARQIQVVYANASDHLTGNNVPKFSGRSSNPIEFLKKLKAYYKRNLTRQDRNMNPEEYLHDIIEVSLEHHAARWFSLIKDDIYKWERLEEAFINKYWSRDVQRSIRQRFENEKYRPTGQLSRSEYFIERVLTLQSLTPPLNEDEIVAILAEHFDDLIQDAKRVQNVNTITEFEALLQREDIKDRQHTQRPKPQSPKNHYRPERNQTHNGNTGRYPVRNQEIRNYPQPNHNNYRVYNNQNHMSYPRSNYPPRQNHIQPRSLNSHFSPNRNQNRQQREYGPSKRNCPREDLRNVCESIEAKIPRLSSPLIPENQHLN